VVAEYVGLNQKLDRLLSLMEEQKKEATTIKSKISDLKSKVREVCAMAASDVSQKSTSSSKKLSTELFVSFTIMQIA